MTYMQTGHHRSLGLPVLLRGLETSGQAGYASFTQGIQYIVHRSPYLDT